MHILITYIQYMQKKSTKPTANTKLKNAKKPTPITLIKQCRQLLQQLPLHSQFLIAHQLHYLRILAQLHHSLLLLPNELISTALPPPICTLLLRSLYPKLTRHKEIVLTLVHTLLVAYLHTGGQGHSGEQGQALEQYVEMGELTSMMYEQDGVLIGAWWESVGKVMKWCRLFHQEAVAGLEELLFSLSAIKGLDKKQT